MLELILSLLWWLSLAVSVVLAVPAVLLLVQVLQALGASRALPAAPNAARLGVLVPAHNEGAGLRATLQQALSQLQATDRLLVVADNCSDDTAAQARAAGATVIERQHATERGKGYALDFGVRHLEALAQQEGQTPDVVIVLDADCQLGDQLLPRIGALALATGRPVQATYLMTAASTGLKPRVAEFAMRVKNWVRPRGMHHMDLPCGLYGTGMAFPWAVAITAPLASGHLAEDMQLGVRLAQAGTPPLFCEDAKVTSVFAASREGEASQRTRWEHGHLSLLVGEGPGLLGQALREKRWGLAVMVLDMLVPPLALLTLLLLAWVVLQALMAQAWGVGAPLRVAAVGLLSLAVAIVMAQQRFAQDLLSLRELLLAPLYMLAKLPIYLRFIIKRQVEWVRTKRD